ncbi:MAG: hypothetical protein J07HQW2_02795 [Haloquadratum walsbyi J07HQW2]|uniref:Uncharacterized protein n=1 Tax=Haloquadratum walsbyi J07HQW2 TaxID=1238425 RepID=U1N0J3_9EURY|nr:MAG: hypothetical protein J07HQW2_02795 [Haloquadratum walsbyi J07HQW2]
MRVIHSAQVNVGNADTVTSVRNQKNEELHKRPGDIDVSPDDISYFGITSGLFSIRSIIYDTTEALMSSRLFWHQSVSDQYHIHGFTGSSPPTIGPWKFASY